MIQIKYSMTKDFDNFYNYHGFLMAANDHMDYISKQDACDMYEHMNKLSCKYNTEVYTIDTVKQQEKDFAQAVQWLADALGRGQVILHE